MFGQMTKIGIKETEYFFSRLFLKTFPLSWKAHYYDFKQLSYHNNFSKIRFGTRRNVYESVSCVFLITQIASIHIATRIIGTHPHHHICTFSHQPDML